MLVSQSRILTHMEIYFYLDKDNWLEKRQIFIQQRYLAKIFSPPEIMSPNNFISLTLRIIKME